MKKIVLYLFFTLFLTISCTKKQMLDLNQLNGYWEIKKVELPDGSIKEYTISQNIDFIKLNTDSTGYRKKLQPKLDGSFYTSDDAEKFKISNETLYYKNYLAQWTETILKLDTNELILINENNLKYFYQRHKKLNLQEE